MSNSPLINYTKISPNSTNPRKDAIKKITIHHMAGNLTVEKCGDIFASPSRKASSNYGIDSDGRIGMYVEEMNRPWTSSNATNDNQAITIEVANDVIGGNWHVSDIALAKLIDLCVDICKRNGIPELAYTGDATGTLTRHNMFTSTSCPGSYLQGKFPYIADEVNKRLNASCYHDLPPTSIPSENIAALAVKHASEIIFSNEGSYGTVNKNDKGALSIGKLQWHGSRALALMKTIVWKELEQSRSILKEMLFNEIQNAESNDWNARVVTSAEGSCLSALLITPQGIAAQEELAMTDITSYVQKGMYYGLNDCGALIYFSDGVNQYGTNSTLWKEITALALKGTGDVGAMFTATKALTSNYLLRRERVYKAVLALNLGGNICLAPFLPYLVRVTVDALNIRTGPGTNFPINGKIQDKGTYTIIGEAAGLGATKWGKLKSGAGWISLDHISKV